MTRPKTRNTLPVMKRRGNKILVAVLVALAGCSGGGLPMSSPELFDHLNKRGLDCPVPNDGASAEMRSCAVEDHGMAFVKAKGDSVEIEVQDAWMKAMGADPELLLDALAAAFEWPPGTASRMMRTRGLDGTQRDGDVSWSYKADAGLSIVDSRGQ